MDARTSVFALLACVLGGLAALMVLPFAEYVLLACVLAVVLRPAHERLAARVGPRLAALALTVVAVVAGIVPLVLVSLVVLRTAVSTVDSLDPDRIADAWRDLARTELGLADESVAAVESALRAELAGSVSTAADLTLNRAVGLVTTGADVAVGLFLAVFLLYYLLVDGADFVAWLREIAPLDPRVLDALFAEVHAVTWAVVRSHVLVAVVQGILGGIGLALLGVPYATTLAVVLVCASFLPTIGVWLVWGPVTVAQTVAIGPVRGALLAGYGVAVLAVVDAYLRAILVDKGSGLHPAIGLVGVVGGVSLFGIVGLFVGPVVLATLVAAVTVVQRIDWDQVPDRDRNVAVQSASAESSGHDGPPIEREQSLADAKTER
ncbi:AI-2E family transporter [Natrinema salifodinae]|uniref:Predicted PurR-regulated permease PerM n=1 Tax=Natrinema salifodinae TaxID=1202768 RepID=A0A1I0M6Z1_9EURY|nr:AI-2E family transporter [Natrinema salifodinae]SEV83131.1 Predicted PurR-regulated permease PerM [Natrinema salifodinae]